MYCMKCGREIEEDQVFCPSCLDVMAKYPVKPGIAIQLPGKKEPLPVKKVHPKRRQPPTPEEQILRLKKRLKAVLILWVLTFLLLCAAIYPTVRFFQGLTIQLPGQNYTAIVNTEATVP